MKRFGMENEYVKWNSSTNSKLLVMQFINNHDHFYASFFFSHLSFGVEWDGGDEIWWNGYVAHGNTSDIFIHIFVCWVWLSFFHFFLCRRNVCEVQRMFKLGSLLMTTMKNKEQITIFLRNRIDINEAFDSNWNLKEQSFGPQFILIWWHIQ